MHPARLPQNRFRLAIIVHSDVYWLLQYAHRTSWHRLGLLVEPDCKRHTQHRAQHHAQLHSAPSTAPCTATLSTIHSTIHSHTQHHQNSSSGRVASCGHRESMTGYSPYQTSVSLYSPIVQRRYRVMRHHTPHSPFIRTPAVALSKPHCENMS